MTPTIRRLHAREDRDAVTDLVSRAADYVLLETGLPPHDAFVDEIFHGVPPGMGPEAVIALGLCQGPMLNGVASIAFGWPEPTDAYLGLMLLDSRMRGQGLGPVLLEASLAAARDRGATRMLLAVLDENPRARTFWERMGFAHLLTVPPGPIGIKTHIRHRMGRAL
jgi:GNAT superfamily N-acetyltransferase